MDTPAMEGVPAEDMDEAAVAIKEAISDMVKQSELAPIARWAKVKDSAEVPERKPVLNSVRPPFHGHQTLNNVHHSVHRNLDRGPCARC